MIRILRSVAMVFLAVSVGVVGAQQGSSLRDTSWQLEFIESAGIRRSPSDPSLYTLQFLPSGRLTVQADCNRGSGRFLRAQNLLVTQIAYTRALCAPESLFDLFTQSLAAVTSFERQGDTLTLKYGAEDGVLVFVSSGEPGR